MVYDCIIIGGGIAGLQAAIQLGRYCDNVLVIDAADGRSNLCRCYHNILGWPEGISGATLRRTGRRQAEELGVNFIEETVEQVAKQEQLFSVSTTNRNHETRAILIATGIKDHLPAFDKLLPCLGISVYICPDCDGYEVLDKKVIVIGSGRAGAGMALALTNWASQIHLVNHGREPIEEELHQKLKFHEINTIAGEIDEVLAEGDQFRGVKLEDGSNLEADHAFVAMGGNEVRSQLAEQLGVELYKNKHILVDPRTKMTNVENVFAAGDIVAHSEQVTIAMGDGMQAAIWIHKKIKQQQ
ncbi:NAD(P)/FAD-dependent oxidoreductase [Sediminibacillus halophilus]|uniref:Thioredoxin reductase n=1 Tax=Sediminibacillus halophilus TaxID=482461 RepID=A0A1G9TG55_9BACI|nr:NAD(P)/FAD-dependent oxidoreductase [Sediminibacillus halophilus]SDM46731.1 Thioredoxin reductase [Sediminibacillus halophilus]